MNWNGKPVKTTGFAVTLAMPLKMNGHIPPEMTGRSNLGTATYISWNVPPEMGDKCQYHLIWVAALPTVEDSILEWLDKTNHLAYRNLQVYRELGLIVPVCLTDCTARWFHVLPNLMQQEIQQNWGMFRLMISSHFMNQQWFDKMKGQILCMRYQQKGHENKFPTNYFYCKQHPHAFWNHYGNHEQHASLLESSDWYCLNHHCTQVARST